MIDNIKTIHEGWGRFHIATVRSPEGTERVRQVEDHGAAVCVLPYDPERHLITLVRQARVGPLFAGHDALLLEAPAGLIDGEDPETAGKREVLEEAGIQLGQLQSVGSLWTMPGSATEMMHLYIAAYGEADQISEGGGEPAEGEQIEIVEMPINVADRMVGSGGICDMKTVFLLQALQLRHPALF